MEICVRAFVVLFLSWITCAQAALSQNQAGAFEAFLRVDSSITGKIEILTTSKNALSGILTLDAQKITLRGQLVQAGNGPASSTLLVAVPASKTKVRVALSIATDGVFSSVVSDSVTNAVLGEGGGEKSIPPSPTVLKALAGSYTVVWNFTDSFMALYFGHAYATAKIDATGHLTLTGKTVEGSAFTVVSTIDSLLSSRVYALPYKQAGAYFNGSLQFSLRSDGKYHVSGLSDGVFTWKAPVEAVHPTGWGPYTLTAWMEPWRYSSRTALWSSLGWGSEPLLKVSIGANGYDSGLRYQYYAIPETAQLDAGFSLAPKDYYSYFSINSNHWSVRMTPATGLFSGSYSTFDTLQHGSVTKIVKTYKNLVGGVFIQPDPLSGIKGSGMGSILNPPNYDFNAIRPEPIILTEK